MRWAEFGLFLAPFALYAAWRIAAATARPAVLWGVVALVVVLAAGTLWYGLSNGMRPGSDYVPARIVGGQIVPGHAGAPP